MISEEKDERWANPAVSVPYVKRDERPELADEVQHPRSICTLSQARAPQGWTHRERVRGASMILRGENHGAVTDTTSVGRAGI